MRECPGKGEIKIGRNPEKGGHTGNEAAVEGKPKVSRLSPCQFDRANENLAGFVLRM